MSTRSLKRKLKRKDWYMSFGDNIYQYYMPAYVDANDFLIGHEKPVDFMFLKKQRNMNSNYNDYAWHFWLGHKNDR